MKALVIILLLAGASFGQNKIDWNTQIRNAPISGVPGLIVDGTTDNTTVIQTQINLLASTTGGTIMLPPGNILINGSSTELLKFPGPKTVNLIGSGFEVTFLRLKSTVGSTVDAIRLAPTVANMSGMVIAELTIEPESGTPGRHGIVIDTTDNYISNLLIDHVRIRTFGGLGIKSINPIAADGFFTSTIQNSYIDNGIQLNRVGDAINILRNSITGSGIGIEAVSFSQGARALMIEGNTVTSLGAGVKLGDWGFDCMIRENRFETVNGATGSNGAYIDIDGGTNGINGLHIENNSISAVASVSPQVVGLRIARAVGTVVSGNTFQRNGTYSWLTTALASDTRILTQRYIPVTDKYPDLWLDAGTNTYVEPRCEAYTITGTSLTGAVTDKTITLFSHPALAYIEATRIDINTNFTATNLTDLSLTIGDLCCGLGYYDTTGLAIKSPTQTTRIHYPADNNGYSNYNISGVVAYFYSTYSGGGNFNTNPVTGSVTVNVCWGLKPRTMQQ